MPVDIETLDAKTLTPRDAEQVAALVGELSSSAKPPTYEELASILENPGVIVFVARAGDTVVGMLTLTIQRLLTGRRAHIEDVVTSSSVRRQGVGRLLTRAAVARAEEAGARTVDLTSRPSRVAANQLYVSEGFVLRESNVYRLTPGG